MFKRYLAILFLIVALGAQAQTTYFATNSGYWSSSVTWSNGAVPPAGGSNNITIYLKPSASLTLTNDLAGDFVLNKVLESGSFNVTNWCPLGNALVFTNNGATAPMLTNQNNFTVTMNQRMVLQSNFAFGPFSGGAFVINSNITESLNSVALTKYQGTVTINASNTISGGFYISGAGTVNVTNDYSLGKTNSPVIATAPATLGLPFTASQQFNSQRNLIISNGVVLTVTSGAGEKVWNGKLSGGQGSLTLGSGTMAITFTNANNDFTGTINSTANAAATTGIGMASCDDSTTNGIVLGSTSSNGSFRWYGFGGTNKTFANRAFYLAGTTGGGYISANGATASDTITILKDLVNTNSGTKNVYFAGSNTGTNVFAGAITNGSGLLTVNDSGTAVWNLSGNISVSNGVSINTANGTLILSGTNTYSGQTIFAANATALTLRGASNSMSPNTSFLMNNNVSSDSSTLNILDDNSFSSPADIYLRDNNSAVNAHVVFVGNNSTANGGSNPSSVASNNVITLDSIAFTNGMTAGTYMGNLAVTGSNGYSLTINSVVMNNLATAAVGTNAFLNPTTANLTISNVTMAAGNTSGRNGTLNLDGTSTSNYVTGTIADPPDLTGTGATLSYGTPVKLLKTSSSTWTLTGTNNYSGSTDVTGGKLVVAPSSYLGEPGIYLGNVSVTNGATLQLSSTATQVWAGVLSGAGSFIKDGPSAITLTAPNTITSSITNTSGSITLTSGGSLPTNGIVAVTGGTLTIASGASPRTFTNAIVLGGGTIKAIQDNAGSGGIVIVDTNVTHVFTASGTLNVPSSVTANALLVGGGGGGGAGVSGVIYNFGGGGGQVTNLTGIAIGSGSTNVTVGTGGAGANNVSGSDGTPSSMFGVTATNGFTAIRNAPWRGGSSGQGYIGGATNLQGAGGGAGAGAVGGNAVSGTRGGVGGVGVSNSVIYNLASYGFGQVSNNISFFGGGGGGGPNTGGDAPGGLGGGGFGSAGAASMVLANSGGGGGGTGSGAGASGIVVIQYPYVVSAGTVVLAGNINLQSASTLDAYTNGGMVDVTGAISGAGGLTIVSSGGGRGSVEFDGTNTYSGVTTISNAVLLVNGDSSAVTNDVNVLTNSAFGGTNIIGSIVRYQSGSTAIFTVTNYMKFTNSVFLTNVTVAVNMPTNLDSGTYVLATNYVNSPSVSGSLSFSVNSGSLVAGRSGSVSVIGNNIVLTVTGGRRGHSLGFFNQIRR